MKYLLLIILNCWLVTFLLTGCQREYREQKHITHVTVEKKIDYQMLPTNLTNEDIQEMNEFQEADLDDPISICFVKCTM